MRGWRRAGDVVRETLTLRNDDVIKRAARRGAPFIAVLMTILLTLAACGGGDDDPTPTPTAKPLPRTPTTVASPSPVSSPIASPIGSPSPAAVGKSITREEFQAQLLATYPMEPAAHEGGHIILGESSDISTVNGILSNDSLTFSITGAIYETLISASPIDGQPVPALADYWEVAPDGITYTFHLNKQAKWHDGVDLTADDVKFSFDAVLDPNTGSSYTTAVNKAVASYRVVDPDTFEIVARDRLVSFLYDAPGTVLVMPKHIWEDIGFESWTFDGGSTGEAPERVIGTGPFKFKEWVQGDHVTIVRNDDYYDVVPTIDEFTLAVQPDAKTAVLSLQSGETDLMEIIPPDNMEDVLADSDLKVDIYDIFQFTFYAFNLDPDKSPLFQDKEVRQALFYALDRDSITENIFLGYGEAAVGTQPKLSPAYAPERLSPDFAFSVQTAKDLLSSAGWTDSNDNGTVDKDGHELKFELLIPEGDSVTNQIASYIQEAWKEVGADVDITSASFGALVDRLESHDFDTALLAFNLTPDGNQSQIFSCDAYKGGLNFMKFCNEEWDRLDELQRREFDPAKRTEELIQQNQITWEEQPVGSLRFGVARTGYSTRLHNFYPNGYGFLWSLPYIWVDE
jgi:peptide/nickel transport system substrate-binding protein